MSVSVSPNDRFYRRLIFLVTIAVCAVVVILHELPKSTVIPEWVKVLPVLNAFLNGTCFVLLLCSLYFIRKKDIQTHKKLNLLAVVLSIVFLLSYVLFHYFYSDTRYPEDHPLRSLYLFILTTHILLAAIVLPLVLLSLYRGLTNQVPLHKKIVRWSYPIWLYVTLTGVIVYLMISPYYVF